MIDARAELLAIAAALEDDARRLNNAVVELTAVDPDIARSAIRLAVRRRDEAATLRELAALVDAV